MKTMMLDADEKTVDLSVVKEEREEMEEYGHDTGNILDNFVHDYEHVYHEYPTSIVSKYLYLFILGIMLVMQACFVHIHEKIAAVIFGQVRISDGYGSLSFRYTIKSRM